MAIAHFPLQRRFAGEAQGHKDPGTVGFIGEHGVALAQDLSAPNAAQLIAQFGRLPRFSWLQLAVGHLQSVFPQQVEAIRQLFINAADRDAIEGAVLPAVPCHLGWRRCRGRLRIVWRRQGNRSPTPRRPGGANRQITVSPAIFPGRSVCLIHGMGFNGWLPSLLSASDQGFQGRRHIALAHQCLAHQHRIGAGAYDPIEIIAAEQPRFAHQQRPFGPYLGAVGGH